MFPQFGATAESLSRASSLVFRIGTDAHLYDDPDDVSIAPLLDSRFDSEKSEALKRLLALIAQGADVSNFFPQVVKNVVSPSLEVKKLVYLYLLHYAEKRPNEALLSINCFQKDLSDSNPLVRAWALRAMGGIRLHVIAPLVLVAVSKCAKDPSAYVRKFAANALPKLHDLHQEENISALEELVSVLLSDHSPGVVGAAAAAFNSVCPNNLSLIGRHFRRLCETLPDVEEWGQIVLIDILLRYVVARHGLVRESIMVSSNSIGSSQSETDIVDIHITSGNDRSLAGGEACDSKLSALMLRYYIEGSEEYILRLGGENRVDDGLDGTVFTSSQNSDVKILLQCTSPLLWSQNSAVVLAAAGVHWVLSSRKDVKRIVKPILFILRSSYHSKYVVLCNIQVFAKAMPSLFSSYYEDFFICSSDSYPMRALKLEILSMIATDSSIPFILQEFQDYIKDPNRRFATDTVAAIALCAQRLPVVANTCLEGLLALTRQESSISDWGSMEGEAGVLVQSIMSIKAIINQDPACYEKVIVHLTRNLDKIKEPSARALVVWILGEYCSVGQVIPKILSIVLGYLARCFTSEELVTKLQILNTIAKVVLCAQGEDVQLFTNILSYVLELAKNDLSYDVRDRARVIEKLLVSHTTVLCQEKGASYFQPNGELPRMLVEHIFRGKTQSTSYSSNNFRLYLPGSLSQIVFHAAPGYGPLPKPCSLSEMAQEKKNPDDRTFNGDSIEVNGSDTLSGSSVEDRDSSYDFQDSVISSVEGEGSDSVTDSYDGDHTTLQATFVTEDESTTGPLIHLSDVGINFGKTSQSTDEGNCTSFSTGLADLMSKTALESWLDEQPCLSEMNSSIQTSGQKASARISVNEIGVIVRPKVHILLDPANGNGLRVGYSFSSEISSISPLLVCVEVLFENLSAEPLTKIVVEAEESSECPESVSQAFETHESLLGPTVVPTIIPMEEIVSLDPGEKLRKILQVRFHHHLLPLKLAVFCNKKRHPIKLKPDIGYFIRPLSMDVDDFTKKERQLLGMFEYTRRCTFTDHIEELDPEKDHNACNNDKILVICRRLASKMHSSANVHLVSVDMPVLVKFDDVSGLCLRFSCEILSSSKLCLITILAEGKCSEPLDVSVKVNCEDTIFGLNLLNRIVAFLT